MQYAERSSNNINVSFLDFCCFYLILMGVVSRQSSLKYNSDCVGWNYVLAWEMFQYM